MEIFFALGRIHFLPTTNIICVFFSLIAGRYIYSNSSVNGSPIDQFDHGEVVVTAKKRRGGPRGNSEMGGAGDSVTSFPISFGIGAGNGETIDLSDPNQRKNLDAEQKAQAMQQLMAIQEQMNKLMADF